MGTTVDLDKLEVFLAFVLVSLVLRERRGAIINDQAVPGASPRAVNAIIRHARAK